MINKNLFPVGSNLYLIAYPALDVDQYYIDVTTGKKIYTSINTSNPSKVINIVVPDASSLDF